MKHMIKSDQLCDTSMENMTLIVMKHDPNFGDRIWPKYDQFGDSKTWEHCKSLCFAVLRPNIDNDDMTIIMIKYDESVIGLLIYQQKI